MNRWRLPLAVCLTVFGLTAPAAAHAAAPAVVSDPATLVNPLLGASNGGDIFPGAATPFGTVAWSPDTSSRPPGGDYAHPDNVVNGAKQRWSLPS